MKKIKMFLFSVVVYAAPVLAWAHPEDEVLGGPNGGFWRNMMGGWGGMMGWGGSYGGLWGWLGIVTYLVWLGISVLVLIWLYKKVFGKK